ncbi:UNVERIFIED_CONTAM: hypothetical protein Slati_1510000 [Sesamum latifolium]|uniref:Uncharacterized protein n=1 Tax=Sesamum latifolium TaxID=2727402 RepID=A0AAW2X9D4_9LAMI
MAQPYSAGTVRSHDPGRTSQRSLRSQHARLPAFSMQRPAQAAIYSSNDLLRLHDHVIARACCEQRACCDHRSCDHTSQLQPSNQLSATSDPQPRELEQRPADQ